MSSYDQLKTNLIRRQNELVDQLETKYTNYIRDLLNHKKKILLQMQNKFVQNLDQIQIISQYGPQSVAIDFNFANESQSPAETAQSVSIPFEHSPFIQQHHQHIMNQMERSFSSNIEYIEGLKKVHNISSFSTSIQIQATAEQQTQIPNVISTDTPQNAYPVTNHEFNLDELQKHGLAQNHAVNHLSVNVDANTNKKRGFDGMTSGNQQTQQPANKRRRIGQNELSVNNISNAFNVMDSFEFQPEGMESFLSLSPNDIMPTIGTIKSTTGEINEW